MDIYQEGLTWQVIANETELKATMLYALFINKANHIEYGNYVLNYFPASDMITLYDKVLQCDIFYIESNLVNTIFDKNDAQYLHIIDQICKIFIINPKKNKEE